MASGTIKAVASKADISALNDQLASCVKSAETSIATTGTDVTLSGIAGFVILREPRSASVSYSHVLAYTKQNNNVNVSWMTTAPDRKSVV